MRGTASLTVERAHARGVIAAFIFMLGTGLASAQDMEPRSYSASPIDTNFLIGSYQRTTGDVALDADLPISDVKAAINTGILAYNRTFDLFGHTGSVAIVLPYFQGNLSGNVGSESKQITREGFGDLAFRLTENLIGSPALTPAEFARREPTTTLGVGVAVVAPTGEYNSQQLINISSHRWAFRPEIGGSQPIGNWFVEGSAGMWIFTDNNDFFGGHVRGQDPIWTFQAHVGYNFGPNLWLAADAIYYTGGRTSLDGVAGHDFQSATRAGFTLSVPIGNGFSAKASFGGWLTAQNAATFDRIGLTFNIAGLTPETRSNWHKSTPPSSVIGRSEMNVPAEHVLHLPGVAPVSWIAVLEPEDMRREIGGNVLAVRHARHLAVLVSEDFDGIVAVSDGALVERTLDAHVGLSLPGLLQSVGYARSDEIHMTPGAPAPSTSGKKQNASTGANFATV